MKSTVLRVSLLLALCCAALCAWLRIYNVNAQPQLRPESLVWEKGVPAKCTPLSVAAMRCELATTEGMPPDERITFRKKLDADGAWDGSSYVAFAEPLAPQSLEPRLSSLEKRVRELEVRLAQGGGK